MFSKRECHSGEILSDTPFFVVCGEVIIKEFKVYIRGGLKLIYILKSGI